MEKEKRTLEVINQEYGAVCAELGDITVRLEARTVVLKNRIKALSEEAASLDKEKEDGA